MATTSFRQEFKVPLPPRSRTPERINAAVEPIPEVAVAIAELLKRGTTSSHKRPTTRKPAVLRDSRRISRNSGSRAHRHTHSASFAVPPASPIDTLASVAAFEATARSPTTFHNLYQSQYPLERASKRARSEIAPSPHQPSHTSPTLDNPANTRPATSYNYNGWGYNVEQGINQGQRMRAYSAHARSGSIGGTSNVDEAELLLNFSRGGSSHGLGISTAPIEQGQWQQRTPALPPFPFGNVQTTPRGSISAANNNDTSQASPTMPAPLYSPISPLINLAEPSTTEPNGASAAREQQLAYPTADVMAKAESMNQSKTEPKAEIEDTIMLDAPQVDQVDKQEVTADHAPLSNLVPEQVAKLPNSLHVPDLDGRRYSDSQQDNPLKRVQLDHSRRSASVPLEYAMSESTEPSTMNDAPQSSETTSSSASKVPDEGAICPGCKNVSNVASEKVDWLQCDGCEEWYHVACSSLTTKQSKVIDKYYCKSCEPKFGKSTKKRTSTRVRNTVDYAGLNEGVLRMPGENREHHYIQSFKEGTLKLAPETFARIPASMITIDFFEKSFSFNEPVLIPSALNPRPEFPGTTTKEEISADDERVLVRDEGQDDMDMVIPQELTVRRVSELYGPKNLIPVIDVKAQESSKGWTVEKWADYYENPGDEPIRNVISLECSQTPLWRLIRRPKVVRDLDLQDSVWPDHELRRSVGFYVLMSVADSYTDFHIDFGGSSVYYHIVRGRKVFFFIPPTPSNLQRYQEWNDMPSQTWTWLPDILKGENKGQCIRVDLYPGDTMLIPAGWIHAVWTPDDSLVIGGNFLTRLHYGMQLRVTDIEKANKTPITFRYPKFQKVMWYAVLQYLDRDPLPASVRDTFLDGKQFVRERPVWSDPDRFGENSISGKENFNARFYSKQEIDGLPEMVAFIFRTVMIHTDRLENISAKTRKAVSDSIPKIKDGREPLDVARDFAMWVAWKRGNEDIPEWAHPDAKLPNKSNEGEKKLTEARMKTLQKASAIHLPERQSARLKEVAEVQAVTTSEPQKSAEQSFSAPTSSNITTPHQPQYPHQQNHITFSQNMNSSTPKTSSLGPRRTACDSCRRRKMRCKHVEIPTQQSPIIFTNPLEATPSNANFFVSNGSPSQQRGNTPPSTGNTPYHQPPPFQVDPALSMTNSYSGMSDFSAGPKQEVTELKKGRTKACYECRRSKRRCIHDEFGKVDPIKQREPVVPRGSAKRKSGPGSEMPLAKKPAHEQPTPPIAPMMPNIDPAIAGASVPAPAPPFVQTKQDGMFRNSTVNDFGGTHNAVNVNPLSARHAHPTVKTSVNGAPQQQQHHASQHQQQRSTPRPTPQHVADWALDPALMDPALGGAQQDNDYADAQDALMAYYQGQTQPNGAPPGSSQDAAYQDMNGFVDYDAGNPQQQQQQPKVDDGDIDPSLEDKIMSLANHVEVPAEQQQQQEEEDDDDDDDGDGIDPGLQDLAPMTMLDGEGEVVDGVVEEERAKVLAKERGRGSSGGGLEDADPETRKLIEQMRMENLEVKGLRRRS